MPQQDQAHPAESQAHEQQDSAPGFSGVLNLYKPVGKSSAHYVYRLRNILGVRKIGHAGTLDPFAHGVLLACIGRGTKLVEQLMNLPKLYRTTLRLGVTNATFDNEQPFEAMPDAKPAEANAIALALSKMIGAVQQTPPAFSAIRIGGVSSYKLAKRGKPTPHKPRQVRIDRIDIIDYVWPSLTLEILCGRGTYIRAIARDLGESLGCGACCETLSREAVGPFRVENAVRLDACDPQEVRARVLAPAAVEQFIRPDQRDNAPPR